MSYRITGKRRTGGPELRRVQESTPKCVVGVGHAFQPLFLHISACIHRHCISPDIVADVKCSIVT
jgi:hypothetical protein